MKTLMCGLTMSLGLLTSAEAAEQMLSVDGTEYPLSALMLTCQSIDDDPAAQIACFNNISRLLKEQSAAEQEGVSVSQALDDLRSLAEYRDEQSGLTIAGDECAVQITYYNNYFHISRRNISTIDVFSAAFDASQLQFDQTSEVRGAKAPLVKGVMDAGATATSAGGVALDSSQNGFTPRPPSMTIDAYASEVVSQLPANQDQAFQFVLVHPNHSHAGAEIWTAFEAYLNACNG